MTLRDSTKAVGRLLLLDLRTVARQHAPRLRFSVGQMMVLVAVAAGAMVAQQTWARWHSNEQRAYYLLYMADTQLDQARQAAADARELEGQAARGPNKAAGVEGGLYAIQLRSTANELAHQAGSYQQEAMVLFKSW